jgi:PAS domain S-box-containing protein
MATGTAPSQPPDTATKGARLLVVENERIVALSLRRQLEALGYEVAGQAVSGDEAIRLAGQLRPHLVLMDVRLEGAMDGVEASAIIRERFHLPVVYLTSYSNREVLERAKLTEPFGYVLKPYEERELHVVIEMALYRHRMERRLQERERWFAATLKSIGDGVIATDEQGRVTYVNPVAERLTGWGRGDAEGRSLEEVLTLVDERSREPIRAPLWQAMRERTNVPLANHTLLIGRDHSERVIDDSASPIMDNDGVALGGVMVFRDVTQQKAAEKAVAKLAAIVSSSCDAITGMTLEQTIFSWNPGAEALYGYAAHEAVGQPMALVVPPDRREELQWLGARVRAGEPVPAFETVRRRNDGHDVEVMLSASPIRDTGGQVIGAAVIARDITQTKRLEESFRQAQKMEAVGRLAGGVAHDFNNLLTVINGYSSVLLGILHDHDKAKGMVEQIKKCGERAASLTQQLLAYSRKQILQPRELDLNALVSGIDKLLGRLIGEDVELLTLPSARPCRVRADPGQLEQVLMNLAVNARDAMPQGGRLTIQTEHVDLDETYAEQCAEVRPGPYVLLAVSDTGVGMDRTILARIFEPFFTTKEPGRGTGMGLATVYGVVKQSGGHVRVYSEPGHGTTFKIYVPRLPAERDETLPAPTAAELPRGSETILLVEDEEAVRSLAQYLLERAGYKVLTASNGAEALEVRARHSGRVDLLVTDVVMPKMGGQQLAAALRALQSDVRVLYVSGYTEDALLRDGFLEPRTAFLQKPFTLAGLTQKVRDVLDETN